MLIGMSILEVSCKGRLMKQQGGMELTGEVDLLEELLHG